MYYISIHTATGITISVKDLETGRKLDPGVFQNQVVMVIHDTVSENSDFHPFG
jgi:hypothetical protein